MEELESAPRKERIITQQELQTAFLEGVNASRQGYTIYSCKTFVLQLKLAWYKGWAKDTDAYFKRNGIENNEMLQDAKKTIGQLIREVGDVKIEPVFKRKGM